MYVHDCSAVIFVAAASATLADDSGSTLVAKKVMVAMIATLVIEESRPITSESFRDSEVHPANVTGKEELNVGSLLKEPCRSKSLGSVY